MLGDILFVFSGMKLELEIFPAATDSRYIRAVSIGPFYGIKLM